MIAPKLTVSVVAVHLAPAMLRKVMSTAVEKAVEALELLPEEMQDQAADYLLSQARKFRALKDAIDEGMADVKAGRVVPWDLEEFLKQAREQGKR
jgi:hypothetical protein